MNFSQICKITKVAPSIVKNWHYNYCNSNINKVKCKIQYFNLSHFFYRLKKTKLLLFGKISAKKDRSTVCYATNYQRSERHLTTFTSTCAKTTFAKDYCPSSSKWKSKKGIPQLKNGNAQFQIAAINFRKSG